MIHWQQFPDILELISEQLHTAPSLIIIQKQKSYMHNSWSTIITLMSRHKVYFLREYNFEIDSPSPPPPPINSKTANIN